MPRGEQAAIRIGAAFAVALGLGVGIYLLLDAVRPNGLVSFSFLLLLPAAICAFLAYAADPFGEARLRRYLLVPVVLDALAVVIGGVVLRESRCLRRGRR